MLRAAVGAAVILAPTGLAAQASAAAIAVNRPCYVNVGSKAAPMAVVGSGFVRGDTVTITSSDGSVDATTTANAAGNIGLITGAPTPFFAVPSAKTLVLTAQDFTTSGTTVTASTFVNATTLAVATKPSQAPLSHKVVWYFSGFTPGHYVYAHYLRRRPVARTRFGRAKGPCGLLKVRARFYPGGHPRYRSYGVQIDDSKRYTKHASPRIVTKLGTF